MFSFRIHTEAHAHPAFRKKSELAKYDAGVKFVAVAITDEDWEKMCVDDLEDHECRQLCYKIQVLSVIQEATMQTAFELEEQLGEKGGKSKCKSTIHSLGGRMKCFQDLPRKC